MARPVREWLADQAAVVPTDTGQKRGSPAALSRTDSAAAWPARTACGRFGYALNLLIDTPSGVALDVQASPARFASEVDAGRDMLRRALERFGYRPKRVAADGAYGSAPFLAFMRDHGALRAWPSAEQVLVHLAALDDDRKIAVGVRQQVDVLRGIALDQQHVGPGPAFQHPQPCLAIGIAAAAEGEQLTVA